MAYVRSLDIDGTEFLDWVNYERSKLETEDGKLTAATYRGGWRSPEGEEIT